MSSSPCVGSPGTLLGSTLSVKPEGGSGATGTGGGGGGGASSVFELTGACSGSPKSNGATQVVAKKATTHVTRLFAKSTATLSFLSSSAFAGSGADLGFC